MSESEYCPLTVVHRHCERQQVEPIMLLAALLETISFWHRFSKNGFDANRACQSETVVEQIIGITQDLQLDQLGCPMDDDDPALHFNPFAEHDGAAYDDPIQPLVSGEPVNPVPVPNDPPDYVPSSLLETLYLTMVHAEERGGPPVFKSLTTGNLEERGGEYAADICRAQRTLLLILREAMNELEREGIELAMQQEREMRKGKPSAEGEADWGGDG